MSDSTYDELEKRINQANRSNRRDLFIAAALTGIRANPNSSGGNSVSAVDAIMQADAVMVELESER